VVLPIRSTHLMAEQWLGAPIHADEREQAVLDLVPLAGAGRQVMDADRECRGEFSNRCDIAFPR
jgi:hypothetical protein